ncbi:unnamed protein product [Nyctereutes procyonoides]|uniref:(raccoon dog) hypothetical protein n=1 Tax=Nyctereutes procyonoides TaxID=34880 RepID=A0A811YK55_NYCPR|nr:unnamed protein product [Nyctereutes procyonoides]
MNYMPTMASLTKGIDKKHLVLIQIGRTFTGFIRFIDQRRKCGPTRRNIIGKDSDTPHQVSVEGILEKQRIEQHTKMEAEKLKVQALKDESLSIPNQADTLDEY